VRKCLKTDLKKAKKQNVSRKNKLPYIPCNGSDWKKTTVCVVLPLSVEAREWECMYCKLVIFSYGLLASFPSFLPLHRAHSCDCHATAARALSSLVQLLVIVAVLLAVWFWLSNKNKHDIHTHTHGYVMKQNSFCLVLLIAAPPQYGHLIFPAHTPRDSDFWLFGAVAVLFLIIF